MKRDKRTPKAGHTSAGGMRGRCTEMAHLFAQPRARAFQRIKARSILYLTKKYRESALSLKSFHMHYGYKERALWTDKMLLTQIKESFLKNAAVHTGHRTRPDSTAIIVAQRRSRALLAHEREALPLDL